MWTGCRFSLAWTVRARGCGFGLNALLFVIIVGIFSVAWSDGSRGDRGLCEAFGVGEEPCGPGRAAGSEDWCAACRP